MKPSFDDKQKNTLKIIDSSIASCEKVRGKLKCSTTIHIGQKNKKI